MPDLSPSLARRLDQIEGELRALRSTAGRITVAPSGAIIASSGLVAPVAGAGQIATHVDVSGVVPATPTISTATDGTISWLTVTPPTDDRFERWEVEIALGTPGNRLSRAEEMGTPTTGWSTVSGATTTQTTADAYTGYGCTRIVCTGTGAATVTSTVRQITADLATTNSTFTFSLWARRATGSRDMQQQIRWFDVNGQEISLSTSSTHTLTSSWARYTFQVTPPATAVRFQARLITSTGAANDAIHIDQAVAWPSTRVSPEAWDAGLVNQVVPAGRATRIELPAGIPVEVRMRGISRLGVPSQWSAGQALTIAADTTPPVEPVTGITVSRGTSTLTLWWSAENMPADVVDGGWYEVQLATNSWFTSGVRTRQCLVPVGGFDGLVLATDYWLRVRPVDRSGNPGPWASPAGLPVQCQATPDTSTPPELSRAIPADVIAGFDVRGVNAVFADAAIGSAKIRELTADKIKAGTIGSETIVLNGASSILRSSNYVGGSSGWRIRGDGDAEFNNVIVRGTVASSTITGSTFTLVGNPASMTLQLANNIPQIGFTSGSLSSSLACTADGNIYVNAPEGFFVDNRFSVESGRVWANRRLEMAGVAGNNIVMNDRTIVFRDADDGNHVIGYNVSIDGVLCQGFATVRVKTAFNDRTWNFDNDGNARAVNGSWISSSDIRLKADVIPVSDADALAAVRRVTPITFRRVSPDGGEPGPVTGGVSAQELAEVAPWAVSEADGVLGVDSLAVCGLLIGAVRELARLVDLR